MALQKIFLSRYQALNFVSTHFHFISLGAEETLSEEILLHVAQFFTDETDCKKLAVFLGDPGGSDFLAQLKRKRSRITPKGIALKILQQWRKEEGDHATRDELLQVLRDDLGWSNIEAQLAAAQQRGKISRTIAHQAIAGRNSFTLSQREQHMPRHKWRKVDHPHSFTVVIDHLRNDVMQHTRTPFPTIPGLNSM